MDVVENRINGSNGMEKPDLNGPLDRQHETPGDASVTIPEERGARALAKRPRLNAVSCALLLLCICLALALTGVLVYYLRFQDEEGSKQETMTGHQINMARNPEQTTSAADQSNELRNDGNENTDHSDHSHWLLIPPEDLFPGRITSPPELTTDIIPGSTTVWESKLPPGISKSEMTRGRPPRPTETGEGKASEGEEMGTALTMLARGK